MMTSRLNQFVKLSANPSNVMSKPVLGGMTNESVGTRFDHGLLGGDGHRRREGGAEHVDGVETQRHPRIDEQNAQPEEKGASARDGGGRNLKRQPHAEEDAERDQANEDRVRSFILVPGASTQAFERPDIHTRFHHSPDEEAGHQDTQQHRLVSEKRLHHYPPASAFPWLTQSEAPGVAFCPRNRFNWAACSCTWRMLYSCNSKKLTACPFAQGYSTAWRACSSVSARSRVWHFWRVDAR